MNKTVLQGSVIKVPDWTTYVRDYQSIYQLISCNVYISFGQFGDKNYIDSNLNMITFLHINNAPYNDVFVKTFTPQGYYLVSDKEQTNLLQYVSETVYYADTDFIMTGNILDYIYIDGTFCKYFNPNSIQCPNTIMVQFQNFQNSYLNFNQTQDVNIFFDFKVKQQTSQNVINPTAIYCHRNATITFEETNQLILKCVISQQKDYNLNIINYGNLTLQGLPQSISQSEFINQEQNQQWITWDVQNNINSITNYGSLVLKDISLNSQINNYAELHLYNVDIASNINIINSKNIYLNSSQQLLTSNIVNTNPICCLINLGTLIMNSVQFPQINNKGTLILNSQPDQTLFKNLLQYDGKPIKIKYSGKLVLQCNYVSGLKLSVESGYTITASVQNISVFMVNGTVNFDPMIIQDSVLIDKMYINKDAVLASPNRCTFNLIIQYDDSNIKEVNNLLCENCYIDELLVINQQ